LKEEARRPSKAEIWDLFSRSKAAEAELEILRRKIMEVEWALYQLVASSGEQEARARGRKVSVSMMSFRLREDGEAFLISVGTQAKGEGLKRIEISALEPAILELPSSILALPEEEAKLEARSRISDFFELTDSKRANNDREQRIRRIQELLSAGDVPDGVLVFMDGPPPTSKSMIGSQALVEKKDGRFELAFLQSSLDWIVGRGAGAGPLIPEEIKRFALLPLCLPF